MRILVVIAYVALIFVLAGLSAPPAALEVQHLDKLLHAVEFMILGLLVAWAAAGRLAGARRFALVLAVGLAVAVGTEVFQRYVPGREASAYDVAADLAGLGLAGAAIEAPRCGRQRG